jgi:hypothetical protein
MPEAECEDDMTEEDQILEAYKKNHKERPVPGWFLFLHDHITLICFSLSIAGGLIGGFIDHASAYPKDTPASEISKFILSVNVL